MPLSALTFLIISALFSVFLPLFCLTSTFRLDVFQIMSDTVVMRVFYSSFNRNKEIHRGKFKKGKISE